MDAEREMIVVSYQNEQTLPHVDKQMRAYLRRWDGRSVLQGDYKLVLEDYGIALEFNMVEGAQPGDYWLIPARLSTKGLLWPPEAQEPHNPLRSFAPLAWYANEMDKNPVDLRCTPHKSHWWMAMREPKPSA